MKTARENAVHRNARDKEIQKAGGRSRNQCTSQITDVSGETLSTGAHNVN